MPVSGTTRVNTRSVRDRRTIRYADAAALRADLDALVAAERAGRLTPLGNWTLGQACGHIASWMSYPYDGYPMKRPPWLIRLIVMFSKRRYLAGDLPAGVRIPGLPDGTLATERHETAEGVRRLTAALARLEREAPRASNPLFGPLTHAQWKTMNLGHAALHLSFFKPS
ncbi:hypothetical protein BH11PLA1_BH11PLA1_14750 [soil metagenome]